MPSLMSYVSSNGYPPPSPDGQLLLNAIHQQEKLGHTVIIIFFIPIVQKQSTYIKDTTDFKVRYVDLN